MRFEALSAASDTAPN